MNKYPFHKYADLFPMITEPEEWKAFVVDIKANGVREPVMLYQGAVLDGRNRHNAAHEAGIDFQTTDFTGDDNAAIDYVISKNIRRRHLTATQCSALAVDLANLKLGDNQYRKEGISIERPSPISLSAAVEKVPGATLGTAARLASVRKADPETFNEAKAGKLSAHAAERKVKAAPKSNRHGKPVPKTTEPIRHHGDGTPKHLDIAKKLDSIFDDLWLGLEPRENAMRIENVLAERNIIPVSDRKRDPRKHLRDLQEKAPRGKGAGDLTAAWKTFEATWNASSDEQRTAFARQQMKNVDTAFCKLVDMRLEAAGYDPSAPKAPKAKALAVIDGAPEPVCFTRIEGCDGRT